MTKRKVQITIQELLYLARNRTIFFTKIKEDLGEDASLSKLTGKDYDIGYYVVHVNHEGSDEILECGVVQKFPNSLAFQISKENGMGMRIKYEDDLEFVVVEMEALDQRQQKRNEAKAAKKQLLYEKRKAANQNK